MPLEEQLASWSWLVLLLPWPLAAWQQQLGSCLWGTCCLVQTWETCSPHWVTWATAAAAVVTAVGTAAMCVRHASHAEKERVGNVLLATAAALQQQLFRAGEGWQQQQQSAAAHSLAMWCLSRAGWLALC